MEKYQWFIGQMTILKKNPHLLVWLRHLLAS